MYPKYFDLDYKPLLAFYEHVKADIVNVSQAKVKVTADVYSDFEKELGELIVAACPSPVVNLIGKTSLKQLLALLKQAAVVVAPDTGPAHMATTVGTPVIGLYGASNPKRAAPYLSQPYVVSTYESNLQVLLGTDIEKAPWGTQIKDPKAMASISLESVKRMLDK